MMLWIILYASDYYLTVHSARGFRAVGHFQFERSYELTPQFQMVAALSFSTFFPGGALVCFGTGLKHSRLAKTTKGAAATEGS
jgi:hypothetical protein